MKDLDYFILEELTKDEFEELTKKYGAYDQKGMPSDLWDEWLDYKKSHENEADKFLTPLIKKEIDTLNDKEKKQWIDLPYKVDIYNKGPKNKNFIFSIRTMLSIVHRAEHWQTLLGSLEKDGYDYKHTNEYSFNGTFRCQLPPNAIHFEGTDKSFTDNFKKNPKVISEVYNDTVYFNKRGEHPTWDEVCRGWQYYFEKVFNQFKGKVTFIVDRDPSNEEGLTLKFADPKIQKEIEEKIKYLNDPERVKELKIDWDKKMDEYYKEQRRIYYDAAIANNRETKNKEERTKRMNELEAELVKKGTSQREIDKQVAKLLQDFHSDDVFASRKANKYWGD